MPPSDPTMLHALLHRDRHCRTAFPTKTLNAECLFYPAANLNRRLRFERNIFTLKSLMPLGVLL